MQRLRVVLDCTTRMWPYMNDLLGIETVCAACSEETHASAAGVDSDVCTILPLAAPARYPTLQAGMTPHALYGFTVNFKLELKLY